MFPYRISDNDKEELEDVAAKISTRNKQPKSNNNNSVFNHKSGAVKRIELIAQRRAERRQRLLNEKIMKELNTNENHPYADYQQMIINERKTIIYQRLNDTDNIVDNPILVCVRKRPLNNKELDKNEIDVVTIPEKDELIVHEPRVKFDLTKFLDNQHFRFDYVFDENCTNELVYKFTAQPLVPTIFDGGYATCFAYGQTGSGKTHTMCGEFRDRHQNFKNGIYGLVAADIFRIRAQQPHFDKNLQIFVSFFEIYGRLALDLLSKKDRLRILEDGRQFVQVIGLTECQIDKYDDVINLIKRGTQLRKSGQTKANLNSSRSHAIFQITLKQNDHVYGRISLIDLAGNERGADTLRTNRKTQLEGADINRSLLALKECIRSLNRKGKHCPFRESLLTKILRDSFVGDKIRTCMIAMISPNICSVEHTLNTLRYADRVKEFAINDFKADSLLIGSDNDGDTDVDNDDDDDGDDKNLGGVDDDEVRIDIDWNVGDYCCNTIEKLTNYQRIHQDLYNDIKKINRFEFAKKWKDILKQMIEDNKKIYNRVSQFCEQFDQEI